MVYKEREDKFKTNLLAIISYLIFFISIIVFVYNNYIIDRPLKVFEDIFKITNTDIISQTGLKVFNTHITYKLYYKKIKEAKTNKEKYNLINEYLAKYNSIYIGFFDINEAKKISRIKRGKLKDNYILKVKSFNKSIKINSFKNKVILYLKINSLWSKNTLENIFNKLKATDILILDLRNFPFGDSKLWYEFYASFLPSNTIWYKNNYGDILQQKKIILGKYKRIHFNKNIILLTDNKTSEVSGLFLSEILDNIDKFKNIKIYYFDKFDKNNSKIYYPPVRGVRYYILNNGSYIYYPVSEYLNSRYRKLKYTDKSNIIKINEESEINHILKYFISY